MSAGRAFVTIGHLRLCMVAITTFGNHDTTDRQLIKCTVRIPWQWSAAVQRQNHLVAGNPKVHWRLDVQPALSVHRYHPSCTDGTGFCTCVKSQLQCRHLAE